MQRLKVINTCDCLEGCISYFSVSRTKYHDQEHLKVEFVLVYSPIGLDFHNDRQHMAAGS